MANISSEKHSRHAATSELALERVSICQCVAYGSCKPRINVHACLLGRWLRYVSLSRVIGQFDDRPAGRRTADYDFTLPADRIAQMPAERRDQSRLMLIDRARGTIVHRRFTEVVD